MNNDPKNTELKTSKWKLELLWDSGWVDVDTAGRESLPHIPWSEILRAKRIVNFPRLSKRLKIHDMSFIVRRLTQGGCGRVLVLLLWLGGEMILAQRTGCRCTFLISFCFQVWVFFILLLHNKALFRVYLWKTSSGLSKTGSRRRVRGVFFCLCDKGH